MAAIFMGHQSLLFLQPLTTTTGPVRKEKGGGKNLPQRIFSSSSPDISASASHDR